MTSPEELVLGGGGSPPATRTCALVLALAAAAGCGGADCDQLKEEARSLEAEWQACVEGDTCVVVTVDGDCTGALGCPFAVNAAQEDAAVREAGRIAEESQDCDACAQPGCPAGDIPVCDAAAGTCVLQ